jgi:GTP cyclohydrolase I
LDTEAAVVIPWHSRSPEPHRRALEDAELERLEEHAAALFAAAGLDLDTPGTRETPRRFVEALLDATSGYEGDPKLLTAFPAEHEPRPDRRPGQVVEGPIVFFALCEHHALPFHGVAHVAYVPSDEIIGISKLTRIVRLHARRFTVQERLGEDIADTLEALVSPLGVAVHLDAVHLCTHMRGVSEDGTRTRTSVWRGTYADDADLRREFLDELRARA